MAKGFSALNATRDQCIEEIVRLNRLLVETRSRERELMHQNTRLNQLLNEAQAGTELAEIIKRISNGN